jgi:hypothetical protein
LCGYGARWPDGRCRQPDAICRWGCSGRQLTRRCSTRASFYQDQIARPWPEVVQDVRQDVQAVIDHEGAFVVSGDLAAFVCR